MRPEGAGETEQDTVGLPGQNPCPGLPPASCFPGICKSGKLTISSSDLGARGEDGGVATSLATLLVAAGRLIKSLSTCHSPGEIHTCVSVVYLLLGPVEVKDVEALKHQRNASSAVSCRTQSRSDSQ